MLNNVNPQEMYIPPHAQQFGQPVPVGYFPPPQAVPVQQLPAGVVPVYNSIPYAPVYGTPPQQGRGMYNRMPDISTVKIELNGLEPPKVPGFNDFQPAPYAAPVYPGATQIMPYPQPQIVQPQPQYPQYPQYPVSNGTMPMPQAPYAPPIMPPAGFLPPPPQFVPYTPPVQQQPPSVIDAQQPPAPQNIQQQPPAPITPATSGAEIAKPLIEALSMINPDSGTGVGIDAQNRAIQTIAGAARAVQAADRMAELNPADAEAAKAKQDGEQYLKPHLIKEDTFFGLANIATSDTSMMTGEDKQKADMNRVLSMWTLSMLQKMFKSEMNGEAKKINIPPISMNEVPGIVQLIDITKKDANPEVRESGIAALKNLADPNDPKDVATMKEVLGEVQNDPAENVKLAATEALKLYSPQ